MVPFGIITGEFSPELADVILLINAIVIALIAAVAWVPEARHALARLWQRLRLRRDLGR